MWNYIGATCLPYTTPTHEGVGDVSPPSSSPLPIPSSSVRGGCGGGARRERGEEGGQHSLSQSGAAAEFANSSSLSALLAARPLRPCDTRAARSCCLVSHTFVDASSPPFHEFFRTQRAHVFPWRLLLRFPLLSSSWPTWHTQGRLHIPFTGTHTTASTPELRCICPECSECLPKYLAHAGPNACVTCGHQASSAGKEAQSHERPWPGAENLPLGRRASIPTWKLLGRVSSTGRV